MEDRVSDQRDGGIAWTDQTWNPIRGCSRVSPGCENCYAEGMAARFHGPGMAFEGLARRTAKGLPQWTGQVRLVPEHLADPLRWKRPRRIFVNSVSDLFHDELTNEQIAAIFGVMAAAPQHTFQVLTKRPQRMREWFRWIDNQTDMGSGQWQTQAEACRCEADDYFRAADGSMPPGPGRKIGGYDRRWPLPNVWLGVSVEDQKRADERIPFLLDTPAAVRWVSAEPLLERVDLTHLDADRGGRKAYNQIDALSGRHTDMGRPCRDVPSVLDWIVVGGESGRGARPFDPEWARAILRQRRMAMLTLGRATSRMAVFVKQMGAKPVSLSLTSSKGGDPSEWPDDLRVQEFPEVAR